MHIKRVIHTMNPTRSKLALYNKTASNEISEMLDNCAMIGDIQTLQKYHIDGYDCSTIGADNAAINGHSNIIKLLHEWGIDCDQSGVNWAAKNGQLEILKLLHTYEINCDPFGVDMAIRAGQFPVVCQLFDWNIYCTYHGPMHCIQIGDVDFLRVLYETYNIICNHDEAISMLWLGSRTNIKNMYGNDALHMTWTGQYLKIIQQLYDWYILTDDDIVTIANYFPKYSDEILQIIE